MASRKVSGQKTPTLSPDRALKALRQQLDGLQKLRNRKYDEANAEMTEWRHFTQKYYRGRFLVILARP